MFSFTAGFQCQQNLPGPAIVLLAKRIASPPRRVCQGTVNDGVGETKRVTYLT